MADNYTPIVIKTGKTPVHSAGSWGHRYSVTLDDGTELFGKAKTELDAIRTLRDQIDERFPDEDLPDFAPKARPVDDLDDIIGPAKGSPVVVTRGGDPEPETAKRPPKSPKAKDDTVRAAGSPRACDMSCLFAHRASCVCQCEGANHQSGWVLFAALKVGRTKIAKIEEGFDGPKRAKDGRDCLCGCGGTTKGGLFLQGHDRKLHAKLGEVIDGTGFFKEEDGVGLVLTPLGRKTLREAKK